MIRTALWASAVVTLLACKSSDGSGAEYGGTCDLRTLNDGIMCVDYLDEFTTEFAHTQCENATASQSQCRTDPPATACAETFTQTRCPTENAFARCTITFVSGGNYQLLFYPPTTSIVASTTCSSYDDADRDTVYETL